MNPSLPYPGPFPRWCFSKHSRLGQAGGRWAEAWWGRRPRWRWTGSPQSSLVAPTASCQRGFPKWCRWGVVRTCFKDCKTVQQERSLPDFPLISSFENFWSRWVEPENRNRYKLVEKSHLKLSIDLLWSRRTVRASLMFWKVTNAWKICALTSRLWITIPKGFFSACSLCSFTFSLE